MALGNPFSGIGESLGRVIERTKAKTSYALRKRKGLDDDDDYDYDPEADDSEALSVWDAADIWESNGRDEDYSFGYSDDELEEALK